jgi:site-specific recombinase XerD
LQKLKAIAKIKKPAGLHTLRHSIASHLLHSGMALEQIQRFLGHSSMESTQIYTHLKHEQI